MKMLLFVSVLAVLTCLGVVVAAVLASNRNRDSKSDERPKGKY